MAVRIEVRKQRMRVFIHTLISLFPFGKPLMLENALSSILKTYKVVRETEFALYRLGIMEQIGVKTYIRRKVIVDNTVDEVADEVLATIKLLLSPSPPPPIKIEGKDTDVTSQRKDLIAQVRETVSPKFSDAFLPAFEKEMETKPPEIPFWKKQPYKKTDRMSFLRLLGGQSFIRPVEHIEGIDNGGKLAYKVLLDTTYDEHLLPKVTGKISNVSAIIPIEAIEMLITFDLTQEI